MRSDQWEGSALPQPIKRLKRKRLPEQPLTSTGGDKGDRTKSRPGILPWLRDFARVLKVCISRLAAYVWRDPHGSRCPWHICATVGDQQLPPDRASGDRRTLLV